MKSQAVVRQVPLEQCLIDPEFNTRKLGPGDLTELVESIKIKGILEPILGVEIPEPKGAVQIYAGFRRLEAASDAGLKEAPVLVHPMKSISEQQMLEFNIVENVHRENLNPVDEAYGYLRMQEDHGMGINDICISVGVKRNRVEKRIRLLKLNEEVRKAVHEGRISITAALEIDRLPEKKQSKYITIAEELSGHKLIALINHELEKMQVTVPEIDPEETEEPLYQEEPGSTVEHIRRIRQCSEIICKAIGYEEVKLTRVLSVDFSFLKMDDLGITAQFFDDWADALEVPEPVSGE